MLWTGSAYIVSVLPSAAADRSQMRAHTAREGAQTKNVLKEKKKTKTKKKKKEEEENRTLLLRLRCLSRPQSKNEHSFPLYLKLLLNTLEEESMLLR